MQIRLTVLAPRGGQSAAGPSSAGRTPAGEPRAEPTAGSRASAGCACDVLITAPAGTALAAVASGLATAVAGADPSGASGASSSSGTAVFYAGQERLDAQRRTLGEPPLIDGAVLSLQFPGFPGAEESPAADAPAQLHVVAGPDAGGVHLLHGGRISIGRSAEADVPLDDPDVSRLHCAVTVGEDGRVTVADLGSTNGTALDGRPVGPRPVRLPRGALLRLGESALRLTSGDGTAPLPTTPDGEGHLRIPAAVSPAADSPAGGGEAPHGRAAPVADGPAHSTYVPGGGTYVPGPGPGGSTARTPAHGTRTGTAPGSASRRVPAQYDPAARTTARDDGAQTTASGPTARTTAPDDRARTTAPDDGVHSRAADDFRDEAPRGPADPDDAGARGRQGTRVTRKRGIGAWARRFAGGREERADDAEEYWAPEGAVPEAGPSFAAGPPVESWPDPAAVLLTALGPGPRLWERGPGHPESLVLRLGTTDRHGLPSVPVTVGLRESGSLGLAGPRARLAGLARSAVAQLAALHSPADLEIVLISTDRARSLEERRAEWAWLGWLPHLRPAHGQDCRLLLAYDRDQAAARTAELTRRLDEGPLGPGWPSADAGALTGAAARYDGGRTVVILDGDPGSAVLRETTARLAGAGRAAGIHLIALAETPAASPRSPVAATYEAGCAASLAFRECGAVAILSGDVATALRLLRTAGGLPAGHGTPAAVDAVSAAWAERFGRALAPLRAEGSGTGPGRAAPLPRTARLLDELGLARATPASLMARWASAQDASRTADATAVIGAGPRGPLAVDLTDEGPHLLIEGPPGSGRTELLRSVAASLAAADRPDRLGLLLVDGSGGERGEGLAVCTELPHVTEHLVASDPLRMRAFAQALGAELKRRAELLGSAGFAEWHTGREVADRMVGPRPPLAAEQSGGRPDPRGPFDAASRADPYASPRSDPHPQQQSQSQSQSQGAYPQSRGGYDHSARAEAHASSRGDVESPSSATLRLRPGGRRAASAATAERPLPRLVVLVDDFDALVAPALGSTGRPAAGSVVRALEAVARDGGRLGVHLVATSGRPDRTADTELARGARLRAVLDVPPSAAGPDDPAPGRGRLGHPDGRVTPFQGGRVTGRIPRTATLRPTVVPLEWERMGDPPTRRPVRELGNGPTDLALLASALERAARSVDAVPLAPLSPAHP
ncbi:FtsK/SpoIIIE domain-containing protein [Streptomyces sp. NPDC055078]